MKTAYLLFLLGITLLTASLPSCITSEQQAKRRISRIIERFPHLADTQRTVTVDTNAIIKKFQATLSDSGKAKDTYKGIDSLLDKLQESGCKDTIIYKTIKEKVKGKCTIEGLIKAQRIDTLGVSVSIVPIGNSLKVSVTSKDLVINKTETNSAVITSPSHEFYEISWFWYFIIASALCLFLLYLLASKGK